MIRTTVAEDFPTLVRLAADTGFFKPIEIEALGEVLDDYQASNKHQGHCCVTFEDSDRALGFAYYAPAAMTDRAWHLWWIAVRRDRHGAGIGSQLLRFVEDDIRARDGRVLFIETGSVEHYAPTRRFYHKHDYEEHAVLKDFYADGDSMVVFRKRLSSGKPNAT